MLLSVLLQAAAAGVGLSKLGASGDIRMNMIIAAALVEGVALLALVVCLLVLFL